MRAKYICSFPTPVAGQGYDREVRTASPQPRHLSSPVERTRNESLLSTGCTATNDGFFIADYKDGMSAAAVAAAAGARGPSPNRNPRAVRRRGQDQIMRAAKTALRQLQPPPPDPQPNRILNRCCTALSVALCRDRRSSALRMRVSESIGRRHRQALSRVPV